MTKLPDSPKKKARISKKIVVNFSPSKEELTVEIDGKWVRYFNADKVLELVEKAKKGRESDNVVEIIETCNSCGVENGHAENCELNKNKDLPN